jgi:hypothetical protein
MFSELYLARENSCIVGPYTHDRHCGREWNAFSWSYPCAVYISWCSRQALIEHYFPNSDRCERHNARAHHRSSLICWRGVQSEALTSGDLKKNWVIDRTRDIAFYPSNQTRGLIYSRSRQDVTPCVAKTRPTHRGFSR